MQQATDHRGGERLSALGWFPILSVQGRGDGWPLQARAMQMANALHQGGVITELIEAGDGTPYGMAGPHATRPMAVDGNLLAVAIHHHDEALQHEPGNRLAVSRRRGRCAP